MLVLTLRASALVVALSACGGSQSTQRDAVSNRATAPAATSRPVVHDSTRFPQECVDYQRISNVAKNCIGLPQKMRDEVGVMPDWLELDGDEQAAMPRLCELLSIKTRKAMNAVGC